MASFKRVVNKETNRSTYYVDGKRVSCDSFYNAETKCKIAGQSYNSSYVTSDNKYVRLYHSYN